MDTQIVVRTVTSLREVIAAQKLLAHTFPDNPDIARAGATAPSLTVRGIRSGRI